MAFDWTDVAKAVAPLAPTLGGVLGGFIPFPGASLAGQALGSLIAKQFGVEPTPDAVHAAVTTSPNELAIAKLNAATDEARAQYPAWAQVEAAMAHLSEVQVTQVNETMRAELQAEGWFKTGWRPSNGWVLGYENLGIGTMLLYGLWQAGFYRDTTMIDAMTRSWPLIVAVLGIPAAVVGIVAWKRGDEKIAGVAGMVPTLAPAAPPPPTAISTVKKK
jgi:hypothetical protein